MHRPIEGWCNAGGQCGTIPGVALVVRRVMGEIKIYDQTNKQQQQSRRGVMERTNVK